MLFMYLYASPWTLHDREFACPRTGNNCMSHPRFFLPCHRNCKLNVWRTAHIDSLADPCATIEFAKPCIASDPGTASMCGRFLPFCLSRLKTLFIASATKPFKKAISLKTCSIAGIRSCSNVIMDALVHEGCALCCSNQCCHCSKSYHQKFNCKKKLTTP